MDIFKQHEIFEIEVFDRMKSARALNPLVFGGGTMLRLCHELNRYSTDLDFWFVKKNPLGITLTSSTGHSKNSMKSAMHR